MEESSPIAGEVVAGRFTLLERCGAGGFGVVWRASDARAPEREVAVKILREGLRRNPRVMERFVREARILENLVHPNVAQAVSWDTRGEHPFIALEFIRGTALSEELWTRSEEDAHFERNELLSIAGELADAVDQAHRRGIIHRDLKPQNVMLVPGDGMRRVKVLDFGIAKILETSASESTTKGRVIGSIQYMAPEQITGADVDARADVFAAGTILFEMLTLRRAWVWDEADRPVRFSEIHEHDANNTKVELLRRVLHEPRPRVTASRSDLPHAVDQVLGRAMAIAPSDRFSDVQSLVQALTSAWTADQDLTDIRGTALIEEPTRAMPDLTAIAPVDAPEAPATVTVIPDRESGPVDLRSISTTPRRASGPVLVMGGLATVLAAVALVLTLRVLRPLTSTTAEPPPVTAKATPRPSPVSVTPREVVEASIPKDPKPSVKKDRPRHRPRRRPSRKIPKQPKQQPETPPPPPPPPVDTVLAGLKRSLARLRADPNHTAAARFELARRIEQRADRLPEARDRVSVKRCAAQSRIAARPEAALSTLSTCLERLARGARD